MYLVKDTIYRSVDLDSDKETLFDDQKSYQKWFLQADDEFSFNLSASPIDPYRTTANLKPILT